ncbi:MAG TPA: Zn-dependent protease [Firmicutes bacterium]|jgi:Zn-dependent membrane protease YugP|nr:Zn-dependent protease [Bacillota bacterium]
MELLLIILIISLPLISQLYITVTYKKTSNIEFRSDTTGYDVARNILDKNGLNNILVVETNGTLTDHYDPTRKVIKLSKDIYHGNSVASASVAAHEVGHAIQDKEGYTFLKIRHAIFPVVSFLDRISYIVIFLGFLLEYMNLVYFGIFAVGAGVLFQIITLPVEINASKRAIKELKSLNLTTDRTENLSKNMLTAAALTYVASTLAEILQLIRLIGIIKDND